ncbi:ROK family protein [Lachnospiraceae bacterium 54-53]
MMKYFFGVDIGGTAVKWAVVTGDYEIVRNGEFKTLYDGTEVLVNQILKVYQEQDLMFEGIGISVPGTLNKDADGTVKGGGVLSYLDGVPLGKLVRERCGIPCFVENDGVSCALGEYSCGALRGCRVGVAVVLGTGVGGGIVINGDVFKGAHAFAGEFSFLLERPGGPLKGENMLGMSCGWKAGLLDEILKRKGLPMDTVMNGHDIFGLIHAGDPDAREALRKFCRHLATQIHNLQVIIDPEVFAIGGGISNQPVLMEELQKALDAIYGNTEFKQAPVPVIVQCCHGSAANLLGAVYHCRKRMESIE